ncbi:MAG TPA: hypothetical protein VM733_06185 [Thermoanaerobaculia bacterium]|nr:hypothetical protein [Thermoanaerobaculia bacterium]
MPTLELPEDVYEALVQRAEKEHRTVEEQAVAELAHTSEEEARQRRLEAIDRIRKRGPLVKDSKLDPVALIREDRDR